MPNIQEALVDNLRLQLVMIVHGKGNKTFTNFNRGIAYENAK